MPEIIDVDPGALLHLERKNPNVMDPTTFELLCKAIANEGFLQPILVYERDDGFVVVDGVHRSKAATIVRGWSDAKFADVFVEMNNTNRTPAEARRDLAAIPAVVAPDETRAELLRLALNRMRGELDLAVVWSDLEAMLDQGFSKAELELTGFAEYEIDALADAFSGDTDGDPDLSGADITINEPKPKTYNITFKFGTESERAAAKEFFEHWGDGDVNEGLAVIRDRLEDERK